MPAEQGSADPKAVGRRRTPTQRLQLACAPCKEAKLKCDRRLPVCEQCYRRSRDSHCTYTERGLRYLAATRDARDKMGRVGSFFGSMLSSQPSDSTSGAVPGADAVADIEAAPSDGMLRLRSSGGTQWVAAAHWESMIEDVLRSLCSWRPGLLLLTPLEIADVSAYLDTLELTDGMMQHVDEDSPTVSSAGTDPPPDIFLSKCPTLSRDDLLRALPPRTETDRLVAAWFNAEDPARVIVHAPTFQAQYHRFWLDEQRVSLAWLALLLFTASLGAEMVGQNLGENAVHVMSERLIRLGAQALVLADSAKPQPFLIEALIYYALARLYRIHDTDSQTWQILGHTMRLCYQAGYHRDPSRNPRISIFDREMRRRVWMVVCELETSVASVLGTFSLRDPRVCDTALPANLDDLDLSPRHVNPFRPPEDCTLVQIEICFARLVQVLGEITASYHAIRAPAKHEVEDFEQKLEHARDLLPEKLKIKPLDQSFIDSPTQIIDRLRLEFVYLKARCVLYRRYLGDQHYSQEREHRIQAASSIVELCLSMLVLCEPGRQLAPLRVMLVRHVHDFNFAAILLCAELKLRGSASISDTDPAGQDAELASLRPKLVEACKLWSDVGVPSAKASVALRAITTYLTGNDSLASTAQSSDHGSDITGTDMLSTAQAYGIHGTEDFDLFQGHSILHEFHDLSDVSMTAGIAAPMLTQQLEWPLQTISGAPNQQSATNEWSFVA